MKHKIPFLPKPLNRSLIKGKVWQRAAIAALGIGGMDQRSIAIFTDTHPKTVHRWICRVEEGKTITDLQRCGRPRRIHEAARLRTIAVYCQKRPSFPGLFRWSLSDAQMYFKEHPELIGEPISRATIHRILLEHAMRPHRRKYYLQITDPEFFPKMENIIGCYSDPPKNLYCFDECTCIQALKRLAPTLPAASDYPALEDFDYKRNGITDLLAFLNPTTGKVYGQCTDNHDRHTLCRVFSSHIRMHPADSVLHYIMDNLSTHYHDDFCKTVAKLSRVSYSPLRTGAERRQWLQSPHKRIVVHFIPFHASWLNMIEIWFGILKSKCLRYEHFFSVEQLCETIMAFIESWNQFYAHPFSWSYTGEGLHNKAVRRFCQLLFIQTEQMDSKFLASQLLLMSNIAEKNLDLIQPADWYRLIGLVMEKQDYISGIIESETGPRRQKKAREAYCRFIKTAIDNKESIGKAA